MQRTASVFSILLVLLVCGCMIENDTSLPLRAQRVGIRQHFLIDTGHTDYIDSLYPLYPNPFNRAAGDDSLNIRFTVEDSSRVLILIQNPIGEEVIRFEDDSLPSGQYHAGWHPLASDGEPLNSGIYFVTFRTDRYVVSRMLNILAN
jgi:hypothetical protein